MHRIQRKPSNETLTSVGMDSTLDSRMSSAEVPQMELLKVNYVHQCKEAFMMKTGSVPNYSFMEFKKSSPHALPQVQRKNIARVTVNRLEAPNKPLPPPPPTVESWQLLQNSKRTTNSPPKFIKQSPSSEKKVEFSSSFCNISYDTANESDSTTMSGAAVKSNSWNYRNKVSTCDIRRDMVRAGIKSRADRIARIEHTECEHSKTEKDPVKLATCEPAIERTSDSNVNPKEAVAKINQMFEAQKQSKNYPPQPNRPAPVPYKEPNRRLKPPVTIKDPTQLRNSVTVNNECIECSECSQGSSRTSSSCSDSCSLISQETVQYRRSDSKDRKSVSRIPKPIQTEKHTSRTNIPSKTESSNKNERIEKSKSIEQFESNDFERNPVQERHSLGIERQVLRNTRISVGNYQKAKVERVHIRKKRQPLLIINQLNDSELKRSEEINEQRKSTCGYKNCNFSNCPMSPADHENTLKPFEDDCNKLKRMSLESNSDSGVSSTHDFKDDKKRTYQLKNIDKCSDVKKPNKVATNKSEHLKKNEKFKYVCEFECNKSETKDQSLPSKKSQVKIVQSTFNSHYNTADPNDVSNFAKKNLTKETTNEALSNSASLVKANTKQCNIENEQRLKIQKNLLTPEKKSTTHIKIDDDWVKEEGVGVQEEYIECDSLMITEKPIRKPINCNDNSVKIFVRSSQLSSDLCRSSCASANSFVSQTSVCTHNSTNSSNSLTSSAASSVSSSGCESSNADNQSLCGSERDCCCQLSNSAGMFFNRPCSALSQEHQRLCAGSPSSSTDAISDISSCVTCSTNPSTIISTLAQANANQCCNNSNGVFWNNSYISLDVQEENSLPPCCCSISSCDEDNCSYYEEESKSPRLSLQANESEKVHGQEKDSTQRSSIGGGSSEKENKNMEVVNQSFQKLQIRNLSYQSQHPTQQQQPTTKRNVRNSTAEEILIRNQLLRKVSQQKETQMN